MKPPTNAVLRAMFAQHRQRVENERAAAQWEAPMEDELARPARAFALTPASRQERCREFAAHAHALDLVAAARRHLLAVARAVGLPDERQDDLFFLVLGMRLVGLRNLLRELHVAGCRLDARREAGDDRPRVMAGVPREALSSWDRRTVTRALVALCAEAAESPRSAFVLANTLAAFHGLS